MSLKNATIWFSIKTVMRDKRAEVVSVGMVRIPDERVCSSASASLYMLMPNIEKCVTWAYAHDNPKWRDSILNRSALNDYPALRPKSLNSARSIIAEFCGDSPIFVACNGAQDYAMLRSVYTDDDVPTTWPDKHVDLTPYLELLGIPIETTMRLAATALMIRSPHNALANAIHNRHIHCELLSAARRMMLGAQSGLNARIDDDVELRCRMSQFVYQHFTETLYKEKS